MDRSSDPVDKRARKGLGSVALVVLLIIVTIFVGYNIYYMVTSG
ncbi:hypothetical protein [Sphingomonas xinjiangensis]|uniref:Uncharacterized protein n=1 Tax=Sphingomonas xinjiangensis TaxID=643568 RepID=A0A840YG33_9SPHN|nr:hypothetical protein [Sphingomonas xinjiangensis]MBB5710939.1 hypothetical protein [Sphingomonas xinjiangensis]